MISIRLVMLGALVGCAGDGRTTYNDNVGDPQLPARGSTDIQRWIGDGYYKSWTCEAAPHPSRAPSPHGVNRICNNDALHASDSTGPYPIGAASVKEIYDGDRIVTYAVYRKVEAGTDGSTWYWYEGSANSTSANGEGEDTCTSCHSHAPRDFVFTQLP